MAVIKLKKNDADYDKSKSYKSETVNYISKKHFKSLECDKKSIRGFFVLKKAKATTELKQK